MEISRETLLGMYRKMLTIRRFEERAAELYAAGRMPGFVHLYVGEEAVATGVCASLTDRDFITSTHRGHGHVIAKGGKTELMMAELYGKATGYCKGKGGSMHIADVDLGILGANGIVGAGQPISVGAAFACKYRKTDAVAVCFFGDGASNRGTFHEAMNMASSFKLPVVFVCENNMYGISNYQKHHMNISDIADRAGAYGVPGVSVDGNDVIAVYEAASEAVARARRGDGPSIVECKTWRQRGHFEGDPAKYKDPEEQKAWLAKDPIPRIEAKLIELGMATQADLDRMRAKVNEEIEAAVKFAEDSPEPGDDELLTDVWAG
ncbi:pyruvate dehydrogenase E1 component alpha subunit [Aminivibrio pyruvatiphilus]|jgi:pyruvate dehydrogenase E1 component alpha subunit|uniref:Pyruvate dehydrogenase E1 component alpha subunit n=2 Tax=Aminivibrio pyruvatiphilus TaxID=1005740 RepID=A0A4R8MKK7_9BACT|nr:pyruvate dehydrogenase E1 component alpha subunit [Aminivibrio pyruvatiphilus]